MRCLVTGGSGFIGSHIVDNLIASGHNVRIFDIRHSKHTPDCEHFIGSILDLEALRLAMNGVDVVFHLAAVADVKDVLNDPIYAENVNTRGTVNVLEAANRSVGPRVIYGSTTWVYGDAPQDTVDEDTPIPPPAHLYTATKLAGEYYCRSYGALYGLRYTILRYGIPYGPRSRDNAVIPTFVKKALNSQPIVISGDGSQFRQFVYVKDLAEGNVAALHPIASGKTYNLDGIRKITIREIAESVRDIVGNVEIRYGEERPGDFRGKMVLSTRALVELEWAAKTGFIDGLYEYVRWFKENHDASH